MPHRSRRTRAESRSGDPKSAAGPPEISAAAPTTRTPWASGALLLAAVLCLYLPTLARPFFSDDYLFLEQVRHRSLIEALVSPDPLSNFFRPVSRQIYYWVLAHASGESPRVFHAVNLGLFVVLLALFFALARRVAGARAAVFGAAIVAISHTADIPVRWAAGAQELLAVIAALAALLLHLAGRRWLAAVALLAGALSKETVLVTPLIAALLDRREGEPIARALRRAWPLATAIAAWALLWVLAPSRHSQLATNVAFDPTAPLAAIAHFFQALIGLEWRNGAFGHLTAIAPLAVVALIATLAAVWLASGGGAAARGAKAGRVAASSNGRVTARGIAWAIVAALPVAAVVSIWSAYYYLFAICGAALAIGAWLASRSRWLAIAVIAVLGLGSASARALDEFAVARTPWTAQSHINGFYLERAAKYVTRYLDSLKRAHPTLPGGTSVFFGGLIANIGFQTADGPLLRWAYRDSSLHSYYLNEFSLDKTRHGPALFFVVAGDTLRELEQTPDLLGRLALSMIVAERARPASDMLKFELRRDPSVAMTYYWSAWPALALGDTASALASLRTAGVTPTAGATRQVQQGFAALEADDTTGAMRIARAAIVDHGLDAGAHGLLADLRLVGDPDDSEGMLEAYAARVLAPQEPIVWRRWGMVQTRHQRYADALVSLERYLALRGGRGQDPEVAQMIEGLRARTPGGKLVAEGLRE